MSRVGMLIDWGMPLNYPDEKSVFNYLKENIMGEPRTGFDWLQQKMYANSKYVKNIASDVTQFNDAIDVDAIQQLAKATAQKSNLTILPANCYGDNDSKIVMETIFKSLPDTTEVRIISLFPQYSDAILGNITAHTREFYEHNVFPFDLSVIQPFYNDADYITLCANHIQQNRTESESAAIIVFAYEGISPTALMVEDPASASQCLESYDKCYRNAATHFPPKCYKHQCVETAMLIAQELNLAKDQYAVIFYDGMLDKETFAPYLDELLDAPNAEAEKLIWFTPGLFTPNIMEEQALALLQHLPIKRIPHLYKNEQTAELLANWMKD